MSIAQTDLKQPEKVDWDNLHSGSKYQAPPPAQGPDGKNIVYYGVAEGIKETDPDDGYKQFVIGPVKIVRSGNGADGYQIRMTWASVRPFQKNGENIKGNPNKVANFLRAVGLQVKPQTNPEYDAAMKSAVGKTFPFVGDWEARSADKTEVVRGYRCFPDDPDRPGYKKAILRAGDVVTERDSKGNVTGTRTIQSEVLFANFRIKYFQDAAPKATR